MVKILHYLFDWGDTLMVDIPGQTGAMCDWPQVRAVDGAKACLKQLSRHAHCHIATNAEDSTEMQIRFALKRVGLSDYITHVFCRENLGVGKTDSSYYPQIISKLGVRPNQIIMIGDSIDRDILAAKEAGLGTIWFNPNNLQTSTETSAIQLLSELAS